MLRAQLNKPLKENKKAHAPGVTQHLVGLRGWRGKRGRQAEGHRSKVGKEGADDVPVLRAAKRPPEHQDHSHH